MKSIYKYHLIQGVRMMPEGAQLLHVGEGHDCSGLFVWALVDPSAPEVCRDIRVVGTGWECPENGKYVGTVQERSGLVWHIFDFGELE